MDDAISASASARQLCEPVRARQCDCAKGCRAGKVTISISTSGASPARTKQLAAAIETLLEQEDVDALDELYIERKKTKKKPIKSHLKI